MTILEAISRTDAVKHNTFTQSEKIEWLSRLDYRVKHQIIDTHEGGDQVVFDGYNDQTDLNTKLLIQAPFDDCYLRWLEAQIDYHNGEIERYNNSNAMYQAAYNGYANDYNRNHMPKGRNIRYF